MREPILKIADIPHSARSGIGNLPTQEGSCIGNLPTQEGGGKTKKLPLGELLLLGATLVEYER